MAENEIEKLADAIFARIKSDCNSCPLGVTREQADAVKTIADGYIISRKLAWRGLVNAVIYFVLGALGWGIISKIGEMLKK